MIKTLYNDREAVSAWLQHAPRSWIEYLQQTRDYEIKQLRQAIDLIGIGRYQGKLEILDRLIGLKEELNGVVGKKG